MAVPQFGCSRFGLFFHQSCYYASQRDKSPAGHFLSFDLSWGAGTSSWPHCDDLVSVFNVIYGFLLLIMFVVQQNFLLTLLIFPCSRQIFHAHLLFTGLDDALSRLEQESRGRPVLFLCWATPATQTPMRVTSVIPVNDCVPKGHTKWGKLEGPVILVTFLRVGPQMLRQNPVISFAVFVAWTSLCWLMVTTSVCAFSRAANIFPATNVWGWRRQAGKCWIMRGMPWFQQRWSDSGRR